MARRSSTTNTPAYRVYAKSSPPGGEDVTQVKAWVSSELSKIQTTMPVRTVKSVTESYTAEPNDTLILADATAGAITITLADPSRVQYMSVTIKRTNTNSNAVIIGGTVDGVINPVLTAAYQAFSVTSDGTQWVVDGTSLAQLGGIDAGRSIIGTEVEAYSSEFDADPGSTWSWLNQGTSTATFAMSRALLVPQAGGAGTNALRLYGPTAVMTAPWTVRALFLNYSNVAQTGDGGGLFAYRSSNGRIHTPNLYTRSATQQYSESWAVNDWSGYGTINATRFGPQTNDERARYQYIQMRCDGTTLFFDASPDNARYFNVSSTALATYIGGTGTDLRIGVIANCPNASSATTLIGYDFFRVYADASLNR